MSNYYSNGIFFRQGIYADDYGYGPGQIGGEFTLIVADSPQNLKKYIRPVFEKHFSDFGIDLSKNSWFADSSEALLSVKLSIENNLVNTLNNDGNYCSRLLFKTAIEDILHKIDTFLWGKKGTF